MDVYRSIVTSPHLLPEINGSLRPSSVAGVAGRFSLSSFCPNNLDEGRVKGQGGSDCS